MFWLRNKKIIFLGNPIFGNPIFFIPAILSTRRFGFLSYYLGKPFYISIFTVDFIMELLQVYKQKMLTLYVFDVQSILQGKVSVAAVNHIYVFHGVMNRCEKSVDSFKPLLKMT